MYNTEYIYRNINEVNLKKFPFLPYYIMTTFAAYMNVSAHSVHAEFLWSDFDIGLIVTTNVNCYRNKTAE